MSLHTNILDRANIWAAVLETAERIIMRSKSTKLRGVDGLALFDLEHRTDSVVDRVHRELRLLTPALPVVGSHVPKSDGELRLIYTYSLIDRIKAHAIERQLEPLFESIYSPNLASYRKTVSAPKAALNVIRRYRRKYRSDHAFRTDIRKYFPAIPHERLRQCVREHVKDEATCKLVDLFIGNTVITGLQISKPPMGLLTGIGLVNHLSNLYLVNLDRRLERMVELYRRVGDDILFFDPCAKRVTKAQRVLKTMCEENELALHPDKTRHCRARERFIYLGHEFNDGQVLIGPNAIAKYEERIRRRLAYRPIATEKKQRLLRQILQSGNYEIHRAGTSLIFNYRHADADEQVRGISQRFYQQLTRFYFQTWTYRNQRRTRNLTRNMPIVPLPRIRYAITHGRADFRSLAVPSHWKSAA